MRSAGSRCASGNTTARCVDAPAADLEGEIRRRDDLRFGHVHEPQAFTLDREPPVGNALVPRDAPLDPAWPSPAAAYRRAERAFGEARVEVHLADREVDLVGVDLAAAHLQIALQRRRAERAGDAQVRAEPAGRAIDVADENVDQPERVGGDLCHAAHGPVSPVLARSPSLQRAVQLAGLPGIEPDVQRQLVALQRAVDGAGAERNALVTAARQAMRHRHVQKLRVEAALHAGIVVPPCCAVTSRSMEPS